MQQRHDPQPRILARCKPAKYALLERRRRGAEQDATADICRHFFCPPPLALTSGLSTPLCFSFFRQPINADEERERPPERESIEAIRPLRPTANKPSSIRHPIAPPPRGLGIKGRKGRERPSGGRGRRGGRRRDRSLLFCSLLHQHERKKRSLCRPPDKTPKPRLQRE